MKTKPKNASTFLTKSAQAIVSDTMEESLLNFIELMLPVEHISVMDKEICCRSYLIIKTGV